MSSRILLRMYRSCTCPALRLHQGRLFSAPSTGCRISSRDAFHSSKHIPIPPSTFSSARTLHCEAVLTDSEASATGAFANCGTSPRSRQCLLNTSSRSLVAAATMDSADGIPPGTSDSNRQEILKLRETIGTSEKTDPGKEIRRSN